jgi:predicted amidohydrolase YtcJ
MPGRPKGAIPVANAVDQSDFASPLRFPRFRLLLVRELGRLPWEATMRVCKRGKRIADAAGTVLPSRRIVLRAAAGFGAVSALDTLAVLPAAAAPGDPMRRGPHEADFVFRNGPVFTADSKQPWARAVAVRDGAIVYVGEVGAAGDYTGPTTRVIELDGKLLLPGFVEGQLHPILGATLTQGVNVQYATREETLQALAAWRAKAGKVDVVRGYGWRYDAFGPYGPAKSDLDALWPDTPVVLLSIDTRAAWANSTALRLAGIVRGIPDPRPGFSFFQRDAATGDPTGYVVEMPAVMRLLLGAASLTGRMVSTALADWLPKAAAEGITSLFDAGIELMADSDGLGLYESIERAKRLPCRIVACYRYDDPALDPMPRVRRLRDRARTEFVRADVLKIVLDGTEAQYTAALIKPYADRPGVRGNLVLNRGLTRDTVIRADAEGFDVTFHAFGDRAVRLALDSIEASIRANGERERRHTIAHLSVVSDNDLPRFADLGVVAQFPAQCAVPDAFWKTVTSARLGRGRADSTYRIGSLLRSGAIVSFGTGWPAAAHRSTFRPLDAIETAVTRRPLGSHADAPLPPADEAITLAQGIVANTLSAARQLRLDHKVGSIAIGKRADLVVLDRDIFKRPSHRIHEAQVELTMMNGVVRHQKRSSLGLPPLPPASAKD